MEPIYGDSNASHTALDVISIILGWMYFCAWSFSFYGQVIENYRRGKVNGLNINFEVYNFVGFAGYTVYTFWGYFDPKLGTGNVQIQDLCFAAHALLLTIITIGQVIYYYDKNDPDLKVSNFTITLLSVMIWGALVLIFVEQVLQYYDPHESTKKNYIFNSLIYLGWCKVAISLVKYIPQVISNYRRKSTIGWNIHNILLDITGGILSFVQNVIDSIRGTLDIEGQTPTLNIAKFAISFVAVIFDVIFIVQHYILYKNANSDLKGNTQKEENSENYGDINKMNDPIIPNENTENNNNGA